MSLFCWQRCGLGGGRGGGIANWCRTEFSGNLILSVVRACGCGQVKQGGSTVAQGAVPPERPVDSPTSRFRGSVAGGGLGLRGEDIEASSLIV